MIWVLLAGIVLGYLIRAIQGNLDRARHDLDEVLQGLPEPLSHVKRQGE